MNCTVDETSSPKMVLLNSTKIPYLNPETIEEFAQIIIKLEDGREIKLNHLCLASWSRRFSAKLLYSSHNNNVFFEEQNDNITISSNYNFEEVVIFRDFIMKGVLPCSENDIRNDKLPNEINSIFLNFGIDLKYVLNSPRELWYYDTTTTKNEFSHVEPKIILKQETVEDRNDAEIYSDHHMDDTSTIPHEFIEELLEEENFKNDIVIKNNKSPKINNSKKKIQNSKKQPAKKQKLEILPEQDIKQEEEIEKEHSDYENSDLESEENLESDEEEYLANKKKRGRPKKYKGTYPHKCKDCPKKYKTKTELTRHRYKHTGDWPVHCDICGKGFERQDRMIKHRVVHDKPINSVNLDGSDSDQNDTTGKRVRCQQCNKNFRNTEILRQHSRTVHFFENVRGMYRADEDQERMFCKQKTLFQYEKKFKNTFKFHIPPPDFTEEDFTNFEFPKPIEELELIPSNATNNIKNKPGIIQCSACKQNFEAYDKFREHYVKMHNVQYICPYENCPTKKYQRLKVDLDATTDKKDLKKEIFTNRGNLFDFARHVYYHEHVHPQLSMPHECIACDFKTPYLDQVRNHCQVEGKFHDKLCPRCPQKFESRNELLEHMKNNHHEGFRCGRCPEVFDQLFLRTNHRKSCFHGEQKYVCEECGKAFISPGGLYTHTQQAHRLEAGTWTCEKCGKVYSFEHALKAHVRKAHNKQPCTVCGKMYDSYNLKMHMNTHLEEHLRPYKCPICNKAFVREVYLKDHMNIHTGKKPHKCRYCGRTFADRGNTRMHERTAHEGYKRSK